MIDIGANFHSSQLAGQAVALLQRAREAGVVSVFATGTSIEASQHALRLARAHPEVFATAGVHPHAARHWNLSAEKTVRQLLAEPKVVAVGECGLDYNRMFSPKSEQLFVFGRQIALALECGKPLFLHCRDAFDDFYPMVRDATAAGATGVVHCFTGTKAEAEAFVALGLDIGVTGWVTDLKRGVALREAVQGLALERLHLETDAPYLMPKTVPMRRGPNEPANLGWVAREIAALKNVPVTEVVAQCTANSRRLFRLP